MTQGDDMDREHGGDDILAAEYVLGVQPAQERQETARRIEADHAFARLVDAWQARLAPLDAGYKEVAPPPALKAAIDKRLFGETRAVVAKRGWFDSLALWRGLAAAGFAAAAVLAVMVSQPQPVVPPPPAPLVASLAADGSDVRYVTVYDGERGEIALSRLAGEAGSERDFELWAIAGDAAPVSLGVIPAGDTQRIALDESTRTLLASGVVLAISLEPQGGSPTGAPTGPVVAAGDLRAI